MYRILGADGKEYGPVTAEVLIHWIEQGRAVAATSAKAEGSADWKPLSQFPEFAAALAAKAAPLAPPLVGPDAEAMASQILSRGYNLSPGHCLGRAWELYLRHFWLLLAVTFIAYLIKNAPMVGWLLAGVLKGGLFFLYLKLIRGQKAQFSDAFAGFNQPFLQLFLAGLITSLLTSVGFLFCILPGIYLAVGWLFAEPLVIDKNIDFWPAMELSRKVVSAHWWQFFGLCLLCLLVLLIGLIACCIGVFFAVPIVIGALAYAYEDVFGAPSAPPAYAL